MLDDANDDLIGADDNEVVAFAAEALVVVCCGTVLDDVIVDVIGVTAEVDIVVTVEVEIVVVYVL